MELDPDDRFNERDLAVSVIVQAIKDLRISIGEPPNKLISSKYYQFYLTEESIATMEFLTGETEISRFWFNVLGREPYTVSQVFQMLLNEEHYKMQELKRYRDYVDRV
jgi:hypothetical protein